MELASEDMRHSLMCLATALLLACGRSHVSSTCSVNGIGAGRCDFTNDGSATGTLCVTVYVHDLRGRSAPASSDVICSGDVRPRETRNVSFSVPGVRQVCAPTAEDVANGVRRPWDENCEVRTVEAR